MVTNDTGIALKVGGSFYIVKAKAAVQYKWRFQLNADLTGSPGSALATIKNWDGTTRFASKTVEDPDDIFTGLKNNAFGQCVQVVDKFYITQAKCL